MGAFSKPTDGRVRDLFPLPIPPSHSLPTGLGLSRSQLRKVRRQAGNSDWLAEGICTLNELCGTSPPSVFCGDGENLLQKSSLKRLKDLYSRVPGKPPELTCSKAFNELCQSSSGYTPTEPSYTARYHKELVSWPPSGAQGVSVSSCLTGEHREFVESWRETLLRSEADRTAFLASSDRISPHLEPSLVKRPGVYGDFIQELAARGMLDFRVGGESLLGIFFVRKKSGKL